MGWTIVDDFAAVLPLFGFFNDFLDLFEISLNSHLGYSLLLLYRHPLNAVPGTFKDLTIPLIQWMSV